jgi:hypothetical protein
MKGFKIQIMEGLHVISKRLLPRLTDEYSLSRGGLFKYKAKKKAWGASL